jgi:hypothetical protein
MAIEDHDIHPARIAGAAGGGKRGLFDCAAGKAILSGVNETESEILLALRELGQKVQVMKIANPKPNLLPVFEKLDRLTAELGRGADPNLLHYLHKKSYEKALLYLEGRAAENAPGSCRH